MTTTNGKTRPISDLALAACLVVTGHPLRSVQRNGRQGLFFFDNTPAVEQATLAFYNRNSAVDAQTFHETLKSLKAASEMV